MSAVWLLAIFVRFHHRFCNQNCTVVQALFNFEHLGDQIIIWILTHKIFAQELNIQPTTVYCG